MNALDRGRALLLDMNLTSSRPPINLQALRFIACQGVDSCHLQIIQRPGHLSRMQVKESHWNVKMIPNSLDLPDSSKLKHTLYDGCEIQTAGLP